LGDAGPDQGLAQGSFGGFAAHCAGLAALASMPPMALKAPWLRSIEQPAIHGLPRADVPSVRAA
jgi:hypothetical protein